VLDFLICDLRDLQQEIEYNGKASLHRAQAVERNVLLLLDSISPKIRSAIAEFERYKAAPKIGGSL
jgi:hypothetical protein